MRKPTESDLLAICAGKWLGLRFPHDSQQFFSLALLHGAPMASPLGFTLPLCPPAALAREGMHGPPLYGAR
jgi:hypothetical protein